MTGRVFYNEDGEPEAIESWPVDEPEYDEV
jgi:hypothetical protein